MEDVSGNFNPPQDGTKDSEPTIVEIVLESEQEKESSQAQKNVSPVESQDINNNDVFVQNVEGSRSSTTDSENESDGVMDIKIIEVFSTRKEESNEASLKPDRKFQPTKSESGKSTGPKKEENSMETESQNGILEEKHHRDGTRKGKSRKVEQRKIPRKGESIVNRYFKIINETMSDVQKLPGMIKRKGSVITTECCLCGLTYKFNKKPPTQILLQHLCNQHNVKQSKSVFSGENVERMRTTIRYPSIVWDYFVKRIDEWNLILTDCLLCDYTALESPTKATGHMLKHLHSKHKHMRLPLTCQCDPPCQMGPKKEQLYEQVIASGQINDNLHLEQDDERPMQNDVQNDVESVSSDPDPESPAVGNGNEDFECDDVPPLHDLPSMKRKKPKQPVARKVARKLDADVQQIHGCTKAAVPSVTPPIKKGYGVKKGAKFRPKLMKNDSKPKNESAGVKLDAQPVNVFDTKQDRKKRPPKPFRRKSQQSEGEKATTESGSLGKDKVAREKPNLQRGVTDKQSALENIVLRYFKRLEETTQNQKTSGETSGKNTMNIIECCLCHVTYNYYGDPPTNLLLSHLCNRHNIRTSQISLENIDKLTATKEHLQKLRPTKKLSVVWDFFIKRKDEWDTVFTDCLLCGFTAWQGTTGRTSSMLRHLHLEHNHLRLPYTCDCDPPCTMAQARDILREAVKPGILNTTQGKAKHSESKVRFKIDEKPDRADKEWVPKVSRSFAPPRKIDNTAPLDQGTKRVKEDNLSSNSDIEISVVEGPSNTKKLTKRVLRKRDHVDYKPTNIVISTPLQRMQESLPSGSKKETFGRGRSRKIKTENSTVKESKGIKAEVSSDLKKESGTVSQSVLKQEVKPKRPRGRPRKTESPNKPKSTGKETNKAKRTKKGTKTYSKSTAKDMIEESFPTQSTNRMKTTGRKSTPKDMKQESFVSRYFTKTIKENTSASQKGAVLTAECCLCDWKYDYSGRTPPDLLIHLCEKHSVKSSMISKENVDRMRANKEYLESRAKNRKPSVVWDYFVKRNDQWNNVNLDCLLCDYSNLQSATRTTSSMLGHLHTQHKHVKLPLTCKYKCNPPCKMLRP